MFETMDRIKHEQQPQKATHNGRKKHTGEIVPEDDYEGKESITRINFTEANDQIQEDDNTLHQEDDYTGMVYSQLPNFNVWIKGYVVVGKGRNLRRTVGLFIFILIVWIGSFFFKCDGNLVFKYLPLDGVVMLMLVSYICFRDPGFFQREAMDRATLEQSKRDGNLHCEKCLTLKSDSVWHCHLCECCVRHFDHHCDVFGTCIARKNLICFWITAVLGPLSIAYIYYGVFQYTRNCLVTVPK